MDTTWFVRPDTINLPLSGGHAITIRKELNAGEERAMFDSVRIPNSDPPEFNKLLLPLAMAVAYLVDWTITDETGAPIEIRGMPAADLRVVLDTLKPRRQREITAAINDHINAEQEEEKKILTGASAS